MTRINIIHPSELYDQHLMAEFREIQHIGPSLQRSLNRKKPFTKDEIPKKYTLNNGHVKFFYDKGLYLHNRFLLLRTELLNRGFNINLETEFKTKLFPIGFFNNWSPDEDEIKINVERIQRRLNEKPNFYKKTKKIK